MDNLEISVVIIITSLLSIHAALGARYNFTEIPWISLITRPKYFGGLNILIRNILWLACWVLVSDIFMLLCSIIIKASELPVSKLYDLIKYESESGGKAGLATLSIITAGMYLMLVRQTAKIVAEESDFIPKKHLYQENSSSKLDKIELQPIENITMKGKVANLVKQIYYIAPRLLAPIYSHFWKSASLIKYGCVRLIYDRYGKDNILEFYKEHAAQTPDKEIIEEIDNKINSLTKKRDKACTILSIKISNKGYHNTNGLLNNYVVTKSTSCEDEKRIIKRLPVTRHLKLVIVSDGKERKLPLIEYSNDGSSIYVLSKWPADINREVQIKQKNSTINCEVIHRNARTYDGQVQFGLALRIHEQEERINILKIIK